MTVNSLILLSMHLLPVISTGNLNPRPISCFLAISEPPDFNVQRVNTFGLSQPSLSAECEKINANGSSKEINSSFFSKIRLIPLSISSCDFFLIFILLSSRDESQPSTSTALFFLSLAKYPSLIAWTFIYSGKYSLFCSNRCV